MQRQNWEYESRHGERQFLLSIPDDIDDADVEYFEGVFAMALKQCRERLDATRNIHERMAIQAALALHCA